MDGCTKRQREVEGGGAERDRERKSIT
jgi:hypothetical protein